MPTEKYRESIDRQIEFNKGKNILLGGDDPVLRFIDNTISTLIDLSSLSPESEEKLIEYATEKALEEFCRVNQYYTFDSRAKSDLHRIYSDLFLAARSNNKPADLIAYDHYRNLRHWLRRTNPFAEKIYSKAEPDLKPVGCSEYSAPLQLEILKIDTGSLMEPVIDIGCGREGNLVKYLAGLGIDITGIDRFVSTDENILNSDWLEFDYGIEKWGTVISNLGFSNHFKHHNLREDGNYLEYAKKYMEILNSLKPGGNFHYAPDLPFIESYLDIRKFKIEKYHIGESGFITTVVKRINPMST